MPGIRPVLIAACGCAIITASAAAQDVPHTVGPVTVSASLRTRVETWDWFGSTDASTYAFNGSIARFSVSQPAKRVAWQLELAVPFLLGLPDDAQRPAPAGALGLGAAYFSANGNRRNVIDAFVKQATVTFNTLAGVAGQSLRVGRMEFSDGAEMAPRHPALVIVKRDRIAQRLIGSFTFTHVGRSFDGARYALDKPSFNVTALAARPTRGVFDVDGWSELDVNLWYGALTRQHGGKERGSEWRVFALGYQDYRQQDRIGIGTFGGHLLHAATSGAGTIDVLLWGALQTGSWRGADHRAGAFAGEAGWQPRALARLRPWVRGGYNYGSGDGNATDGTHGTFFQVLPTPRIYARFPFFNLMNLSDAFATLILRPSPRLTTRLDVHALGLANDADQWYQGGGAFQNATFGYNGRPSNGHSGLATFTDISADVTINPRLGVTGYFGYARGGAVPDAIYGASRSGRFGYVEAVIRF